MDFALNMMDFVLKLKNVALKMMNRGPGVCLRLGLDAAVM